MEIFFLCMFYFFGAIIVMQKLKMCFTKQLSRTVGGLNNPRISSFTHFLLPVSPYMLFQTFLYTVRFKYIIHTFLLYKLQYILFF